MSSLPSELSTDRPRLEKRLRSDLLAQKDLHGWPGIGYEKLQEVEIRIQSTARKLEPSAPLSAIEAARRDLAYEDLATELVQRAQLPEGPDFASSSMHIRIQHLEHRILDLAHDLDPKYPEQAIARATPIAHGQLWDDLMHRRHNGDPSEDVDEALERLPGASRRLGRHVTYPEPTRHQRVHRVLGDLRSLEILDQRRAHDSQMRSQLAFRGNVIEIRAALERVPEPHDLLEESVARIYRDPALAIRGMRANTRSHGLPATIDFFAEKPAAFGELRGVHFPGFGDSPGRSKALDLVKQSSASASAALTQRDRMERDLDSAVTYQRRQTRNRDLAHAYPTREKLLTELGRHMEGLELHQVRPRLRPGQAKLVQDVRRAEQHFLEPLRQASRSVRALDAGGARLGAQAQKIAGLFQGAPRHIVSRLTPPQMQAVLVAVSIANRAKKFVARVASV